MSRHPLDPAFAKIERAEIHINDLSIAVDEFLRTDPYRILPSRNRKGTMDVWSVVPDPIPSPIETIAADAIHNLRTPLDKMLSADFSNSLIHTDEAVLGSIKFPIGEDANGFERALAKQQNHFTAPVVEFLQRAQPYPGGHGELLWAVNKLDNRDKHRTLLEPIRTGFSTAQIGQIKCPVGRIFTIGSRRGQHLFHQVDTSKGPAWIQPIQTLAPVLRLRPLTVKDYFLEFKSTHNDMEVLTTTPSAQVDADIHAVLNIAFAEIGHFEGEPVVGLLKAMREAVEAKLMSFRESFF